MNAHHKSSDMQVLELSELEAVCGGGFWKDVGYQVGVAARGVEEFFEEAVEGFYNIATTGAP